MARHFVFILFVILLLAECKTESRKARTNDGSVSLKYDSTRITIISSHKKFSYPFDSLDYKPVSLIQEDIEQLDSLLISCVAGYNSSLDEGHDDYRIDLATNEYKRQIVAVVNSKGEKEVWVNCFCSDSDKSWRTEILLVDDGGPCYFNFKANLATGIVYDLSVNGFS